MEFILSNKPQITKMFLEYQEKGVQLDSLLSIWDEVETEQTKIKKLIKPTETPKPVIIE